MYVHGGMNSTGDSKYMGKNIIYLSKFQHHFKVKLIQCMMVFINNVK